MDKAFERSGLYGFFGIWIPGALTVTYYLFTMREFFYKVFTHLEIKQNGFTGDFLIIILYTAIAYIIGVILHEAGKLIADTFNCFSFQLINTRNNISSLRHPKIFHILYRIRYEYKQELDNNGIDIDKVVNFDRAISYLKYDEGTSTKRIDTYHAVYALSRSLCLCFLGHIVLSLIVIAIILLPCYLNNWDCKPYIYFCVIDFILLLLFFLRTYRYFHTWVKNVYIQYYTAISINQSKQLIW